MKIKKSLTESKKIKEEVELDEKTSDRIYEIFNDELTNWSYDDFMSAGAMDKEDIAKEAIKEFPDIPEQKIYDMFWNWANGLDEESFKELDESKKEDLKEADETAAEETGVIDADDSTKEIADQIQDAVATDSEGTETISDEAAKKAAEEAKKAADEVEADYICVDEEKSLAIENSITKTLDMALAASLKDTRRAHATGTINYNVLICGLPGSGKSASVYDWASRSNVNLKYINAKDNDLEAYINGYSARDDEDRNYVKRLASKDLNDLERPNSVMFLDEFNRQVKPQIRAALLTLIQEHAIAGPGGKRIFKNLLFTVAAINPSVPTDKGAAPLNDAEKSRFLLKIKHADSNKADALEFFKKAYDKAIKHLNRRDPDFELDLEEYLRRQDLAMYIVDNAAFHFDDESKLEPLADKDKTMLNQRSLTEGIAVSAGDPDMFIWWLENRSDFLDENISMIKGIVMDYKREKRTLDYMKKAWEARTGISIYKKDSKKPAKTIAVDDETTTADEKPEEEDDEPLWAKTPSTSAKRAVGGIDARSRMRSKAASW